MTRARKTYSLIAAANEMEIDRGTLLSWIEKGAPFVERPGVDGATEWKVNIPAVYAWRENQAIEKLRKKYEETASPDGEKMTLDEAKRRRAMWQAVKEEVEGEQLLGSVVLVEDVVELVVNVLSAVRERLKSVGARAAGQAATMTSPSEIKDLIDDLIQRALEALKYDAAPERLIDEARKKSGSIDGDDEVEAFDGIDDADTE